MKTVQKHLGLLAALLAAMLAASCGTAAVETSAGAPGNTDAQASPAQTTQAIAAPTSTPEETPALLTQAGAAEAVLLDEKELYAAAEGYRFTAGGALEVDVTAANENGNPATIWFLFANINGWDVDDFAQSTVIVALQPGESKTETISFSFAAGTEAAYLGVDAFTSVRLAVEGYVDSSDYEYTMRETVLTATDAPTGYAQAFGGADGALYDDGALTVSSLGETNDGGALLLYYGVRTPAEGAHCTLYPIEHGVYDTEKYLVPEKLDLSAACNRLLAFTPAAGAAMPEAFYALTTGSDAAPARLSLGAEEKAAGLDGMPVLAETALVRLRFDAATRRLVAENLTADTVLSLEMDASFTLDGREIKANRTPVLCFPGTATAFRVSGRGKDANNVERSITVTEGSHTLSAGWAVAAVVNGNAAPTPCGEIAVTDAALVS